MKMLKGPEFQGSLQQRSLDIMTGMAFVAMFGVPTAVAGTAAAIDTRDINPFFEQRRHFGLTGINQVIKFRTIRENAIKDPLRIVERMDEAIANLDSIHTVGSVPDEDNCGTFRDDVSWLGQIIRSSGMDEALQVLPVLTGKMSMVGPRPTDASHEFENGEIYYPDFEKYKMADEEEFNLWLPDVLSMKAAIFGLSQQYRKTQLEDTPQVRIEAMKLDRRYKQEQSVYTNLSIIAKAPVPVLRSTWMALTNVRKTIPVVTETAEVPATPQTVVKSPLWVSENPAAAQEAQVYA